jgi:hypothetical protein
VTRWGKCSALGQTSRSPRLRAELLSNQLPVTFDVRRKTFGFARALDAKLTSQTVASFPWPGTQVTRCLTSPRLRAELLRTAFCSFRREEEDLRLHQGSRRQTHTPSQTIASFSVVRHAGAARCLTSPRLRAELLQAARCRSAFDLRRMTFGGGGTTFSKRAVRLLRSADVQSPFYFHHDSG